MKIEDKVAKIEPQPTATEFDDDTDAKDKTNSKKKKSAKGKDTDDKKPADTIKK